MTYRERIKEVLAQVVQQPLGLQVILDDVMKIVDELEEYYYLQGKKNASEDMAKEARARAFGEVKDGFLKLMERYL